MATYTYDQLKDLTVADLREIAKGIENPELEGFSVMHKDHLLPLLCKVLNIPMHHIASGGDKAKLKAVIRKIKPRATTGPETQRAATRRQIHDLKRRLRRLAAAAK